ncbi:MAG: SagB/ThcOx family dehydrogenase [Candidatus Glassbacteria bacterium]|nr:SagB/ThcOx family dehydrogenase [Candidatus Glassbacteria bacterium]
MKEIIAYHDRTKHGILRLAPSAGYLDRANQPLPFRFYEGAPGLDLPLGLPDPDEHHLALYRRSSNLQTCGLSNLSKFLELSLGLSAWKELQGNRWSLRMNPSSGNLHPTECHLILPGSEGLDSGLYHYSPFGHSLERRAALGDGTGKILEEHFGGEGFLLGLTSIFWRESWKYGERAYRYCNHDTGHALACLSFSAALLGWKVRWLGNPGDSEIAALLGLDRTGFPDYEDERADLLCFVAAGKLNASVPGGVPVELADQLRNVELAGTPNRLSREHREWKIIGHVAQTASKPSTEYPETAFGSPPLLEKSVSALKAAEIIRRRRSVWEFSMEQSFAGRNEFLSILDRTVPRSGMAPFDCGLGPARVQLVLFVHDVSGLEQGLYAFLRDESCREELEDSFSAEFAWERADGALPLYVLRTGDYRNQSMTLSCNQQIAGFGTFAVAMVARFRETLEEAPWAYPQLFRECGQVGQALYLEAEAQGLRGTGIGCYFDDPVHELLGIQDNRWQSLYHFTVGAPIEDARLQSYPPYFHLKR